MEHKQRKRPRLKQYDYSLPGYYYVTIHTLPDTPPLSQVMRGNIRRRAEIRLMPPGKIAQQQLFELEKRYSRVQIDKFAVMPTHIHVIFVLLADSQSKSVSLTDVVCAYKSLSTRAMNQSLGMPGRKWFQTSFYETVLKNERAYQECWRYIDENPDKWVLNPNDI